MRGIFISILKYLKILAIVLIIISAVVFVVSKIFGFKLSIAFFYASMTSMALGVLSIYGNISMTADPKYFQTESASRKSIHRRTKEIIGFKDSTYFFLFFMIIVGILLKLISNILINFSL